ncbi:MAG: hypothetical protein AAGJ81_01390 [Verrucomicrobiota bacterium]
MIQLPIIGCHAYVALAGLEIDGVTVSKDAKPDGEPEVNWKNLGVIEQAVSTPSYEGEATHYAPAPGGYKPRRSTFESAGLVIALTTQDMDELIMALAMAANQPDAGGNYVPGSLTEKQQAWLKVQKYRADTDQLVNVFDMWSEVTVADVTDSRQVTKPVLNFRFLQSDLNVGQFSNLT